ncbi:nuclease [Thiohalocapsa halophila]|uniref:Nuclease n=1 Tax=Thiohalocapsa halophila TaxID=69359 RepID=A0ABS1CFX5_9GAMM|nr:ERCC4 domain-containing protein [Thiohalocapsa halophila]MBK1630384.1 nuclease [Thiohalocapsa halophila]
MDARFSVIADDRERGGSVVAALRKRPDVLVEVARLAAGDYRVDDHLLVERKTLTDLTASIKDGRLFTQAIRLANAPLPGILILEGRARDLADSRMRREAIQGALIHLAVFLRLPILRAQDPEETAWLVLAAARQARNRAAFAPQRPGRRPCGKARTRARILQGLPGVGPERARRLIERFGSVEATMAASAQDLATVPGIGPDTAKLIRWAVEEPTAAYPAGASGDDPEI